jgi:acyl carrier protein
MELRRNVREIVLGIIEMEPDEIRDDQSFRDLGIDSLMALDILTALEKSFKIKLSEDVMRRFTNIENVSLVVEETLARHPRA